MAGTLQGNRIDWDGDVSDDGHRSYSATYFVKTDDPEDGPWTVLQTPGLPLCGAPWSEGNDFDPYVFASCAKSVKRYQPKGAEKGLDWAVKVPFSSKGKSRCCEAEFENPLDEPQKVSFSTETETKEALVDRYGDKILTSSHEVIRGPQNEWEEGRFKVTIVQHVIDPELPVLLRFLRNGGAVNSTPMWGFEARCVRFCAPCGVEELYFGQCVKYFKRTLTFDVRAEGHDRYVTDEGTKALNGHWGTSQGTGATVDILTVSSGSILTATLGSGGSGYPRSATIFLTVRDGSASGGVVKVRTNSSGICISTDFEVYQGGTGYAVNTGLETSGGGGGWVLDDVRNPCDGSTGPPDPSNPSHFSRYKDRDGNPTTVILDGAGLPYDPCRDDSLVKFWCINDGLFPFVSELTCFEAVDQTIAMGPHATLRGPFDSEDAAEAICTVESTGALPEDVYCEERGPGEVTIEKCPDEDLTVLGIPLVIGGP